VWRKGERQANSRPSEGDEGKPRGRPFVWQDGSLKPEKANSSRPEDEVLLVTYVT
jgi:hypothetical protein